MEDQLLDAWRIHCRINLYLLDAIPAAALGGVSASKGRSVGGMFAHIHNVRLLWLDAIPELRGGLEKVEKGQTTDKRLLRRSLEASGRGMAALIERGLKAGRVKGFKPHPAAFVGYAIAHESYHHGEIGMTLTQSGHPLDQKAAYGMWEWGVR